MHRNDNLNAAWDLARLRLGQADAERRVYLDQALARGVGNHVPGRTPPGPATCVVCGCEVSTNNSSGKCRACWHRDYTRANRKPESDEQKERRRVRQRRKYAERRKRESAQERAAANTMRRIERARRRLAARGIVT